MIKQAFQEKFNDALALKEAGRLGEALDLHKELYEQLVREAEAYARILKLSDVRNGIINILKSDNRTSTILNNICVILAESGDRKSAEKYFKMCFACLSDDLDSATHKSEILVR